MIKCSNRMSGEFTANPSKYPNKSFREKPCKECGTAFKPCGPSHFYCQDSCRTRAYQDKYYKREYGVGLDWVEEKLIEQGYTCAICKKEGFKMRDDHMTGLNLDHCHNTGAPRGLLCHNCNRALGLLQDDPEIIKEAARYVGKKYDS